MPRAQDCHGSRDLPGPLVRSPLDATAVDATAVDESHLAWPKPVDEQSLQRATDGTSFVVEPAVRDADPMRVDIRARVEADHSPSGWRCRYTVRSVLMNRNCPHGRADATPLPKSAA